MHSRDPEVSTHDSAAEHWRETHRVRLTSFLGGGLVTAAWFVGLLLLELPFMWLLLASLISVIMSVCASWVLLTRGDRGAGVGVAALSGVIASMIVRGAIQTWLGF